MLQLDCNFVMCFRAKEKAKPKGQELIDLGWMPIGGEEHLYEMTLRALLPPNADGVPVFQADRPGERLVYKLPAQFRDMFSQPHALCEADGEAMARWAAGPPRVDFDELLASLCQSLDVDAWRAEHAAAQKQLTKAQKQQLAKAGKLRRAELEPKERNEPKELLDLAAEAAAHDEGMTE
jgi:hypothetical protein